MYIKVNPESGIPLYFQIIKQIKYLVACGALKAGDQLPPVRDLAMQLRINPNTVARAYHELRHEKIIAEALDQAIHQATSLGLTKEEITQIFTNQLKQTKGGK